MAGCPILPALLVAVVGAPHPAVAKHQKGNAIGSAVRTLAGSLVDSVTG